MTKPCWSIGEQPAIDGSLATNLEIKTARRCGSQSAIVFPKSRLSANRVFEIKNYSRAQRAGSCPSQHGIV